MATLYSGIFGVILLLPFNIGNFTVSNINSSFITSLLYTGLVSTVLCMVFWNIGVQKLGATTSGIFLNFNPIFTAILAFIFLREELTWIQISGTIIVVTGCYLFSHFKTIASQPTRTLVRKHSSSKNTRHQSGDVFIYLSFLSHTVFLLLAISVLLPFRYHHLEFPTKSYAPQPFVKSLLSPNAPK